MTGSGNGKWYEKENRRTVANPIWSSSSSSLYFENGFHDQHLPCNTDLETELVQLTHNLNFQRAACRETFSIFGNAGVSGLVGITFNIFNDQSAIREHFLFAINWQGTVV